MGLREWAASMHLISIWRLGLKVVPTSRNRLPSRHASLFTCKRHRTDPLGRRVRCVVAMLPKNLLWACPELPVGDRSRGPSVDQHKLGRVGVRQVDCFLERSFQAYLLSLFVAQHWRRLGVGRHNGQTSLAGKNASGGGSLS